MSMSSGPVDGVAHPGWFEFYDDTVEVDPSSAADRAFLAGLRARAVSHVWPCDPDETFAYHAIDDDQHLLRVGVWLHVWLTCGLEFDGTRIAGGDVYHGIPFDREGLRSDAAMEHSGSVEFLVERAGEWFEWLLSWPIERREWVENVELVYQESVLSRIGRRLTGQMKPQPARPPDRITLVRGVPEPRADRGGAWLRWWRFGKRRGR